MTRTLVLNAAEGRLQWLVAEDDVCVCAQEWMAPSRGTEMLTPLLADTLRRLQLTPADFGRIACVTGPGSFTGLRLALATAAGIRRATGALLGGVNYLQALAAGVSGKPGARVRVLTHARRNLVHCQDFRLGETLPEPLDRPRALTPDQAAENAPDLVLGSGLDRNREFFQARFAPAGCVRLLSPLWSRPSSSALLAAASAALWQEKDLDPLYLRPCDAEDNLETIAARRGQSPEQARAELDRLLGTPPVKARAVDG